MKIFLIYSRKKQAESNIPPFGIMYLAAALRENGYTDIKLFDQAIHSNDLIVQECFKHRPELIGLSADSIGYENGVSAIKAIQAKYSGIYYVLGGIHPTIAPEQSLLETNANVVVIGEGEDTIVELVMAIDKGKELRNIKGLGYFEKGNFVKTKARPFISDLDSLPFPARDLLPMEEYLNVCPDIPMLYPTMTIIASRGCKGNCIYCQPVVRTLFGNKMRHRSVSNIMEEIIAVNKKYSFNSLYFIDDELLFNGRDWIEELCNGFIDNKLNIKWVCQGRVDQVDSHLISIMKRAGLYSMGFGVESGSQKILNYMRKGYRAGKIKQAFEICRQHKIITTCNLMVGTPGESYETIRESCQMLKTAKPDFVRVSITTPTPGSDIYYKIKQEDCINLKHLSEFDRWAAYPIKLNNFTKEDIQYSIKSLLGIFYRNLLTYLLKPGKILRHWYLFKVLLKRYYQIAHNPARFWKDISFYLTYYWQRKGRD